MLLENFSRRIADGIRSAIEPLYSLDVSICEGVFFAQPETRMLSVPAQAGLQQKNRHYNKNFHFLLRGMDIELLNGV